MVLAANLFRVISGIIKNPILLVVIIVIVAVIYFIFKQIEDNNK